MMNKVFVLGKAVGLTWNGVLAFSLSCSYFGDKCLTRIGRTFLRGRVIIA